MIFNVNIITQYMYIIYTFYYYCLIATGGVQGLSKEEAVSKVWLTDQNGLVTTKRKGMAEVVKGFARQGGEDPEGEKLLESVKEGELSTHGQPWCVLQQTQTVWRLGPFVSSLFEKFALCAHRGLGFDCVLMLCLLQQDHHL